MTPRIALILILGIDAAVLMYEASSLSLTYHGAKLIYGEHTSVMTDIIRGSLKWFGNNDLALRLPMILMNLISAVLLFFISEPYARNAKERVWLVLVFVMLPGVISSALLVDSAALVIVSLFSYLLLRRRFGYRSDVLLPLFLWADPTFMVLFAALAIEAVSKRRYVFFAAYLLLFGLSIGYYGFNTGGLPQSQFLDTLGIFAAVFSPIVFIYLVYVLYRRFITSRLDLLWHVSATALLGGLLLSFRQRVEIEQFAPYLMAALPLAMQTFYHSYRVRLRRFRKRYRTLFTLAVATLVVNAAAVFFNKAVYLFLDDPSGYFAYRAHVVKELSVALKVGNISCVDTRSDDALQLRLRFYGIGRCPEYVLRSAKADESPNVTVRYYNVPVATFVVSKVLIK